MNKGSPEQSQKQTENEQTITTGIITTEALPWNGQ